MKGDMAGAAAVLGRHAGHRPPEARRARYRRAACVENMPSGTAQRPGDIVRAMTGKTIEMDNTDAEGRLILADAVAYAESLGARTIMDVATLTGACVIALGHFYTGLIANDDALAAALIAAGPGPGSGYWPLPGDPDYKEQYKSDVADIKNTGGREAGAITGGLIISEFVEKRPLGPSGHRGNQLSEARAAALFAERRHRRQRSALWRNSSAPAEPGPRHRKGRAASHPRPFPVGTFVSNAERADTLWFTVCWL